MDPSALSEIDQLISMMASEKVGSNRNAVSHSHGVEQTHHEDDFVESVLNEIAHGVDGQTHHDDDTVDEEFLDSVVNEMTRGNVSNLDKIDDGTIAAIFPPPPVALPTQDTTGNTTAISNVVNHQLNNSSSTPASGVSITFQLADQTYQLSNEFFMMVNPMSSSQNGGVAPGVAATPTMPLPTTLVEVAPPSVAHSETLSDVPKAEEVVASSPRSSSSGSRKRKLYEIEEEFSDPEMEKKRKNAINAKRHRDMKNQSIQNLQDELKIVKQERDELKQVNERQTLQSQQDQASLVKEVENLKKEKEEMRKQLLALQQKYQDSLQQEKIDFPDFNFSSFGFS